MWHLLQEELHKHQNSLDSSGHFFFLSLNVLPGVPVKVLALRNLVPSLSIPADESFAPYDPKRHVYDVDIIKPDMDSLMLSTKFDMDQTRMRVAISANSCAANASCSTLRTANSPGSVDVDVNISAMTCPLNVTLVI